MRRRIRKRQRDANRTSQRPDRASALDRRRCPRLRRHVAAGRRSSMPRLRLLPATSGFKRARAYLAKIPPAVAGQRGHDRTFHAACVLIQGFDLTVDEARPLLHEWNLGCIPPWSPVELEHKLRDAARQIDAHPRGYLCDGGSRPVDGQAIRVPRGPGPRALARPADDGESLPETECPPGQEANPHRLARLFLSTSFVRKGELALRFGAMNFMRGIALPIEPFPQVKSVPN